MEEKQKEEMSAGERASLVATKRKYFAEVRAEAAKEFDDHRPCERCGFLGKDCHRTCGVIMKHVSRMPR